MNANALRVCVMGDCTLRRDQRERERERGRERERERERERRFICLVS